MKHRRSANVKTWIIRVSVAIVMCAAATPARAEPTEAERESARTLLDEGDVRLDAGDLAGALRAYEAADTIMNVPTTAIEVAKVRARRGELLRAREAARRVVAFPTSVAEPTPFVAARVEANALLGSLETWIPIVTVVVRGPPAEATKLFVDGAVRPAGRLELDPGPHTFSATADGFVEDKASVMLAIGARQTLALSLVPRSAPSRPGIESSPLFWIGTSVAATGLGIGAGFGGASLDIANDIEAECPGFTGCPARLEDDHDRATAYANASNVAFAFAGAGAILALVGGIITATSDEPPVSATTPGWSF